MTRVDGKKNERTVFALPKFTIPDDKKLIVEGFDRIEKKLDRMGRVKDCLNGDELLDNYDMIRSASSMFVVSLETFTARGRY